MRPDRIPSRSHLVLIPTYNTGRRLFETVRTAMERWNPVWVVVDGSTDGSDQRLQELTQTSPDLRVMRLAQNSGKGAAVLRGLEMAAAAGFEHVLTQDADGQHPPEYIEPFMRCSLANPDAMILGQPQFGPEAPSARVFGHRFAQLWIQLETGWGGIGDSLFGFRVYPIRDSLEILQTIRGGRGYDIDTELAVRLFWRGVRPINLPVAVRYFNRAEGGVSHFRYWRDNARLVGTHAKLLAQTPLQMMRLRRRRLARGSADAGRGR